MVLNGRFHIHAVIATKLLPSYYLFTHLMSTLFNRLVKRSVELRPLS